MTPTRKLKTSLLAAVGLSVLAVGAAHAQAPDRLRIQDGQKAGPSRQDDNGRDRPLRQVYPGAEQCQTVQAEDGRIVIVCMNSREIDGELPPHRMQGMCVSVEITQTGPVVRERKRISNNRGDRYRNFNHPGIDKLPASFNDLDGTARVVTTYNYAPDNRSRRYMQILDTNCNIVTPQTQVQRFNNDDCCMGDSMHMVDSNPSDDKVTIVEMDGANGNGRDDAWIDFTDLVIEDDGSVKIENRNAELVDAREERSRLRGMILEDEETAVACGTSGNNQPQRNGVYCAAFDIESGDRLWKEFVDKPENGVLKTRMKIAKVSGNLAAGFYTYLTDQRNQRKGLANQMGVGLRFSREGMEILNVPQPGLTQNGDSTHTSLCRSKFGVVGQEKDAIILGSASFNGSVNSFATLSILSYNESTRRFDIEGKVNTASSTDMQWLSNIYGNNPNTQGRNFPDCTGDVENPNFGIAGAYMSNVKTFVAIASTDRRALPNGIPEPKLGLELVLVPAVVAAEQADTPPQNDDPAPNPGGGDQPQNDDPSDTPAPGNSPPSSNDSPSSDPAPAPQSSLGGCAVSGDSNAGFAALLALALVLVGRRRRRQ